MSAAPPQYLTPAKRTEIERLVADLVDSGGRGAVTALFAANDAPPPAVSWAPGPAELADTPLAFLLDYWREKCADSQLPVVNAIDPLEMKPALGIIMLLDVLEDGWDYRYRLYGSQIAARLGRDLTGWRTSDIARHAHTGDFFLAGYRAVIRQQKPLFTRNASPAYVEVKDWTRLILPLRDAAGAIIRLLVGNVPGDWREAAASRPYG